MTIHELANSGIDCIFKVVNGRVEYDSMGYPRNASGNWVIVARMTSKGVITRRLKHDTKVIIISK